MVGVRSWSASERGGLETHTGRRSLEAAVELRVVASKCRYSPDSLDDTLSTYSVFVHQPHGKREETSSEVSLRVSPKS